MKGLVFWVGLAAASVYGQTLHVDDVIASVKQHYPPLLIALAENEIADAEVLAAEGRFDLRVRSQVDSDSLGYYSNRRADVWLEQPLATQGMSLYSGYRVGSGDFAPYEGKLDTRSLGEFRTGLKMPLLRDRSIDTRRGELAKARIGRKLASLTVDQQRLVILQSAIQRYWTWVANGRRLVITREVLGIAEARQSLLEEGVREGQLAAIEAIDNQRAILQRRTSLIDSERVFQQSAIELSLLYRGSDGKPVIAGLDRVPSEFPAARPVDIESLEWRRPEVDRLEATRNQMDVDREMAANAMKPAVDVIAGFTNDSGSDPSVRRGPQEFKAGLSFDFPLRNRTARGKFAATEAKLRQLDWRARFLWEQIEAEVRDAAIAVEAALRRVEALADEVRVSRELEQAERTRFELGEGTLFMLNLREQATADAAIRSTLAQAEYQRAVAGYQYATGALLN